MRRLCTDVPIASRSRTLCRSESTLTQSCVDLEITRLVIHVEESGALAWETPKCASIWEGPRSFYLDLMMRGSDRAAF